MKIRIICVFTLIIFCNQLLYSETPLMRELNRDRYPSIGQRDQNLTVRDRLSKWFPNHFVIFLDSYYYVSTPRFNDIKSDFYIRYNVFNPRMSIMPDTTATFTENAIVLRNNEIIPANGLTYNDFYDIKNQIAWLTVLFRSLGSPLPELMITQRDEVDTWVIVNENDLRQRVILPSFAETILKLNLFYEGYTSYFQMNEIVKMNNRLEFYGTLFLKDRASSQTDFVDVRFHTNRQNQIDLIMFFIYRDV